MPYAVLKQEVGVDVRAYAWWSFRHITLAFFGSDMIMVLKQVGTFDWSMEMIKMATNAPAI